MLIKPPNIRWLRVLATAAGIAFVMVSVRLAYMAWKRVDISNAQVERIHTGMTEEEVVGVLGIPPGDYRTDKDRYYDGEGFLTGQDPAGTPKDWLVHSRHVILRFQDGKVVGKEQWPRMGHWYWPLAVADALGFPTH